MNISFLKKIHENVKGNFFIRKNFSRVNMNVRNKSKGYTR